MPLFTDPPAHYPDDALFPEGWVRVQDDPMAAHNAKVRAQNAIATDNLSNEHGTMLTSVQKENNMNDNIIWFSDCDHCKGSGIVIGGDQERQCSKCRLRASDEARKVEVATSDEARKVEVATARKQEPRYYIADAGRGYGVVSKDGDGEYDWFPTLDEAQDALDHLTDPEGVWTR